MLSSKDMTWATPQAFFDELNNDSNFQERERPH